ncbi:S8 family serine peptidase [Luteimonas abyssi]|uniref:S8 family serine peptidase n=1 Tax=Luteimonas abyssi TaxID=1247514 RepID=UPI000737AD78|nr:S8 family serine peptidase [Luteimonas abyssi]
MSSRVRKVAVGVGLLALAAAALASTSLLIPGARPAASSVAAASSAGNAAGIAGAAGSGTTAVAAASAAAGRVDAAQGPHIVVFREPALSAYEGQTRGLAAPERRLDARGKPRLDTRGAAAREYVSHLQQRQTGHERAIAQRLQRPVRVDHRMQHAINAVVLPLADHEVRAVEAMPEVMFVEAYREDPLDTDTGPRHIGAGPVWDGSNPGAPAGYQGEGVVFGIIDTGINFGSPSFAEVDPVDGYTHVNPLGDGVYLGTCAPGGVDEGRCNAKLIGGYNFVCGEPGNQCGLANVREEPGFGDTNSHGSHVASTAAGNRRDVDFRGNARRISGVAPRGHIVAFDTCYTVISTGQGSCPNVSTTRAINQAVADGVVDVLNYSIGGGGSPWTDAVSMAFLNASNAGIYVAASAGNSGPGPNTMGHLQPWVASTAASQHGRGAFVVTLQVTGPAPVPEPLTPVLLVEGTNGVPHESAIPGTTPLRVSADYDGAADGCEGYPAGYFEGAIALVRRGTCSFTIKTDAAAAAGARVVLIANNAEGALTPSVPDTTIPAFGVTLEDGIALRDFARAHDDATAGIGYPPLPAPNTADALGAFSSRGPAGTFDLVKPDLTAPGVAVLAVDAGDQITGFEQALSLKNGTSMASPHHAGAAGLVRQARPDWSVPEIKSALALTAEQEVYTEDTVTLATPFGKGSGRIAVDRAINAGLVMHETGDNYLAADPAQGGDVSALNQPSIGSARCFRNCSFVRTFRNPTDTAQTYRIRLDGVRGGVTPANVSIAPGATRSIRVLINSTDLPTDGSWHFGQVVMEPVGATVGNAPRPTLRLPVAISVPPPAVSVPDAVSLSLQQGRSGTALGSVANVGGSTLDYAATTSGNGALRLVAQLRGAITNGYRGVWRTDAGNPAAQFAAEDFVLPVETRITSLFTEGFVVGGGTFSTVASSVGWAIFPDAGGVPAGNPASAPQTAVWRHATTPAGAGVVLNGANFGLDLVAAGQNVVLPAGRYWLVAYARTPYASSWAWFAAPQGDGSFATISLDANGNGAWATNNAFAGLSLQVAGEVPCGAPWIGQVTPASGQLAPEASRPTRVMISSSGLSAGRHVGSYCVESNDPAAPRVAAPVILTVTP